MYHDVRIIDSLNLAASRYRGMIIRQQVVVSAGHGRAAIQPSGADRSRFEIGLSRGAQRALGMEVVGRAGDEVRQRVYRARDRRAAVVDRPGDFYLRLP